MHSFKIILISLAPVLAMPATSPRDINSDEPFDFGQGFLVPANVSIDEYDSTPMISLSHLNPRDLASLKEPSLQSWVTSPPSLISTPVHLRKLKYSLQSVNPKTAVPATRYYLTTNPNFQAQKHKMSKFSNYINMRKKFGDTIYVEIDVTL
ncbi:hypothetical protein Focb16_v003037 [Fusarium oxysporum f. sp. cubense]|uniref:Uncharacterized protein n=1 Tax=Fusarium oxysporum f. sp. cubense TaxID=61366 RepID=A0A559L4B3_FUSOC|nr:hypothetical protein Focb16_v003037 [Fusarium oxysporum f. sp. cubense]